MVFSYSTLRLFETIKELGWQKPGDTDVNSTNCLLNSLGNTIHKRQHGFHPYASELSKLIREGYISRENALSKIEQEEDPIIVQMVEQKLYN